MAATTPTQHAAVPSETDATDSIELSSLKGVKVKASSILDDDEDTYGPMNLLDGKTQTCWNSDQVRQTLLKCKCWPMQNLMTTGG